jgi:hypothetical protein
MPPRAATTSRRAKRTDVVVLQASVKILRRLIRIPEGLPRALATGFRLITYFSPSTR